MKNFKFVIIAIACIILICVGFYSFSQKNVTTEKELTEVKVKEELSGEDCELCGRPMYIKYGPHGRFQACSGFPDCRRAIFPNFPHRETPGIHRTSRRCHAPRYDRRHR